MTIKNPTHRTHLLTQPTRSALQKPVRLLAWVATLAAATGAHAGVPVLYWPETSGLCSGTLQECINAAAPGVSIEIVGSLLPGGTRNGFNEINESVTVNKPLILHSTTQVPAIFKAGHTITVDLTRFDSLNEVSLSNLSFIRGGVHVRDRGAPETNVTYTLSGLNFVGARASGPANILIERLGPARSSIFGSSFFIENNTIDLQNDATNAGAIKIQYSLGPEAQPSPALNDLRILNNRIVRRVASGSPGTNNFAIWATLGPSHAAPLSAGVRIAHNFVSGPFFSPVMFSLSSYESGTPMPLTLTNNMITGGSNSGSSRSMEIVNSSSNLDARITNNTIAFNPAQDALLVEQGGTSPQTQLALYNNLVAQNFSGVTLMGGITVRDSHNLFHQTGSHTNFTPNPVGLVTGDPVLESTEFPAPRSEVLLVFPLSPAYNAGLDDEVDSTVDMTGEQRILRGRVDIGAVELSYDKAFRVTAGSGNITSDGRLNVTGSIFPGTPALRDSEFIVATPVATGLPGASLNFGVSKSTSGPDWFLFHQPTTSTIPPTFPAMQVGEQYHVLVPYSNNTTETGVGKYGYRHTTFCSSTCSGNIYSNLSAGRGASSPGMLPDYLTNSPNRIVAVTPRYESPSGTTPETNRHNHRIGVEYIRTRDLFGNNTDSWVVVNQDGAPLPPDANDHRSFNVVIAAQDSPNAVRVGSSSLFVPLSSVAIDHPLLNNNPCAAPIATLNMSSGSPPPLVPGYAFTRLDIPYALEYRAAPRYGGQGHWYVVTPGNTFSAASFNIIVDGLQAQRCRSQKAAEDLFADSFE